MKYTINVKQLNYGQRSFIDGKKLSPNQIAVWIGAQKGAKISNSGRIANAEFILQNNWKRFANWVNRGLITGEIKGVNKKLSNGTAEAANGRRETFNSLSPEVQNLMKKVKTILGHQVNTTCFQAFWCSKAGLYKDAATYTARVDYDSLIPNHPLYAFIIENECEEQFINYISNKLH